MQKESSCCSGLRKRRKRVRAGSSPVRCGGGYRLRLQRCSYSLAGWFRPARPTHPDCNAEIWSGLLDWNPPRQSPITGECVTKPFPIGAKSWKCAKYSWHAAITELTKRRMRQAGGKTFHIQTPGNPTQTNLLGGTTRRGGSSASSSSRWAVAGRRHKLRIPSFGKPNSLRPAHALKRPCSGSCPMKKWQGKRGVPSGLWGPPYVKRIPLQDRRNRAWSPEEDALLAEVASKLGRSEAAVMARRFDLGVPLLEPQFKPWTRAEEALLGTKSDAKVARALGRTELAVQVRRRMDIASATVRHAVKPRTADEERLLGQSQ